MFSRISISHVFSVFLVVMFMLAGGFVIPAHAASLTMDGTGQTVTISGGNAVRVLYAGDSLTLNNLTIANGYSTGGYKGGGIYHCCSGTLALTQSTVCGNRVAWEGRG